MKILYNIFETQTVQLYMKNKLGKYNARYHNLSKYGLLKKMNNINQINPNNKMKIYF